MATRVRNHKQRQQRRSRESQSTTSGNFRSTWMIFFGLLGCGLLLMNFNGAPLKGIMQNQMEWRKTARFYDAKVTPPTSKVNPDIDPQAKADRITYRVVPGFRQIQGEQPWQCHLNERVGETEGPQNINRALLWPEMRHLFNFSTYIDFIDLRILFMGGLRRLSSCHVFGKDDGCG